MNAGQAGRDLYERQTRPDPPDREPRDPGPCYSTGISIPQPRPVAPATPNPESVGSGGAGLIGWTPATHDEVKPVCTETQLSFWDEHNHSEWVPCVPALCDYAAAEKKVMTNNIGPAHPAYERDYDDPITEPDHERFEGRGYISGPMRGEVALNQAAFNSLAVTLRRNGWVVHNPHETASSKRHFEGTDVTFAEAIREDIALLMDSTAIFLLPGWRNSEGARLEVAIAHALGLVFYEAELSDSGNGASAWSWTEIEHPETVAEGVDQEARRLVYGDRAATYGHPKGDFESIGEVWTALIKKHLKMEMATIPPELVAIMMAGLKLVRLAATPNHRDSQVDTIGYILCEARVLEDPAEIAAWNARANGKVDTANEETLKRLARAYARASYTDDSEPRT